MKHCLQILVVIIFWFLINPTISYACSKKTVSIENKCCSKMNKLSSKQTDCSDKEEQKSCDGSCNSSNCNFSPIFSSIIIAEVFSIPQKSEIIVTIKPNFFYLEKNISLNYLAIWSPPKIS
ncbi:hypothetical protein [Flavobacterium sp. HNIBRBA15423]|uniref:hypothetical protein n=1 Tax=Flavobacterium sp. HNIBRBA15423 TaxID=3458683 RepID=UPI004044A2D3